MPTSTKAKPAVKPIASAKIKLESLELERDKFSKQLEQARAELTRLAADMPHTKTAFNETNSLVVELSEALAAVEKALPKAIEAAKSEELIEQEKAHAKEVKRHEKTVSECAEELATLAPIIFTASRALNELVEQWKELHSRSLDAQQWLRATEHNEPLEQWLYYGGEFALELSGENSVNFADPKQPQNANLSPRYINPSTMKPVTEQPENE